MSDTAGSASRPASGFAPGELVRARGREWVVLSAGDTLRLRPLTGSELDAETVLPELEDGGVRPATFDPPSADRPGPREAAQLLRDALRLSLRRGAGPFRGAGRINFEPRSYQLAPLMMALRQETARLLIADDVGIGKTIEAGLILREYVDRGEIDRFAVLCPPHLVDQWVAELDGKFALPATAVTASSAARLERDLPGTASVFEAHPWTVVSLDFIKSPRRFSDFLRACPEMVVVDEAHASVAASGARHLRFELLQQIAADRDRHLLLLTATPHSGDEEAFHNLLGLLDPAYAGLREASGERHRQLREKLAGNFIQRRRGDIAAWNEPGLFPRHEAGEAKYRLTGEYERFYSAVLEYCAAIVEAAEGELRQRLAFWGTLALMRCVGSSPAAAVRALRTRATLDADEAEAERIVARARDDEDLQEDDAEPGAPVLDGDLADLIAQAERLAGNPGRDPKIAALREVLTKLLADGHAPVVFCRYIATAEAVGQALATVFKDHDVEVVTGALPPEDREARVQALGEAEKRILVATDCLSEGINLQASFDAVVHYDLSWNPTRHQQREGRVDRFGQKSPVVRSVLIYGENNPVDGAVLEVILRKARAIERQTGVAVPLPDESGGLTRALMSALLLRARERRQLQLDLGSVAAREANAIDVAWRAASEREKRSRTIFAQQGLKPDEVIGEWRASVAALGGFEDVERFVSRALMRLGAPLSKRQGGGWLAPLHLVPASLRERLQSDAALAAASEGRPLRVAFEARPAPGSLSIHRAHPLPGILAETFLENALETLAPAGDAATLPRCGVWASDQAGEAVALLVLRIRHRIDSRGRRGLHFAMAEEAAAIALELPSGKRLFAGAEAFDLLDAESGTVPDRVRAAQLDKALGALGGWRSALDAYAAERASALAADHGRLRQALGSRAAVRVTAVTPADVIGLYVVVPRL